LSLGAILLDYKREKDIKKSLFAIGLLFYLFSIGYSGAVLMRAIPPLFFVHIMGIIIGYFGFIFYLWRDKFLWYLLLSPLVPIIFYIILNFLDGSRYEALRMLPYYFT